MAALTGVGGLSNENPDPVDVANFLLRTKGLDKAAVGELLGGHDDESVAVMRAFARSFDFSKLDFDVALRVFLKPFRLPGEAQKIDRLMEAFAARYCACNDGAFANTDAAYVLAFAVIMLNTDAHNDAMGAFCTLVPIRPRSRGERRSLRTFAGASHRSSLAFNTRPRRLSTPSDAFELHPAMDVKMTRDEFAAMARSAESGGDVDDAMLHTLYDRVVKDEIKFTDEEKGGGDVGAGAGAGGTQKKNAAADGAAEDAASTRRRDSKALKEAKEAAAAAVDELAKSLNLGWKRRDAAAVADAASEEVLRETRGLFENADPSSVSSSSSSSSAFHAASEPGLARPMLEAAAAPLLRALEGAYHAADDAAHAALPLECARASLRLSAELRLPKLRRVLSHTGPHTTALAW